MSGLGDGRSERLQGLDEPREILGCHMPDDILINAEVVVHDLMSHSDDVFPGDLGVERGGPFLVDSAPRIPVELSQTDRPFHGRTIF